MSGLQRFKKLRLAEQRGFVARVRAGHIDEPSEFSEMEAWLEAAEYSGAQLPGGITAREVAAHEARVRAGMVDGPGDADRWKTRVAAERAAETRRDSLRGYRPPYPWSQT